MKKFVSLVTFDLCADVDTKEVFQEISLLEEITPETVVGRARSPNSPLHKYFEWDDTRAAHKFRLSQARHLVLSIGLEDNGHITRAFESVVIDKQRVYLPIEKISQSNDLIEQVIAVALRELAFWKMKYQRHQQFFGGVFGEITKAEQAHRGKNGKKETSRGKGRNKANNSTNKKANRKNHNSGRFPTAR